MTGIQTEKKMDGLTEEEAIRRQQQYGKNELTPQKKAGFLRTVLRTLREPMFLLLMFAAVIYFLLGQPRDGALMLLFVLGMITLDVIQEWKTDQTLKALRDLSAPQITVIREGREQTIASADLVPGDLMLIYEGIKIPADGRILQCADLCVDESSLTGESEGVWKTPTHGGSETETGAVWRRDACYAGTLVTQGSAVIEVETIGANTAYGRIGLHLASAPPEITPLQKQTGKLVRRSALLAGLLFLTVAFLTFFNLTELETKARWIGAILSGVTLAMAMIPEEFPVILTVFLSMGAGRLAKKHSLVRRLPRVETLGAISVLCVDKTGTITQNQMEVQAIREIEGDKMQLLETMGMGCETETYDPMEQAMLRCCEKHGLTRETLFRGQLVAEYAFTHERKMMGHVWKREDGLTLAAKGSPEQIFRLCGFSSDEEQSAQDEMNRLASAGLRVIAIAVAHPAAETEIPAALTDCRLTLLGLVGLADPPRETISEDIARCRNAGIRVVMITGDNDATAWAIAKKTGITEDDQRLTGEQLDAMDEDALRKAVQTVSIFARVIPEHKMRIVQALRKNGEIVAMTGDGVNDAPALKYADIGIAMGKRGSEVAREAADLILMDDHFTTIVETIRDGRRIYDNIRKAIGYVVSIHIPIALSSLLAPILGINPASLLLLPLHVVLLEILIDPTCSIVLERQPAERDIMNRPPRNPEEPLLSASLLLKSAAQGLAMFAAAFGSYRMLLEEHPDQAPLARAMGITVMILANLFLVQVNSSDIDPALRSAKRLIRDPVMWAVHLGTAALIGVILYTPISGFLQLAPLRLPQLLLAAALAALSTLWYEPIKLLRRSRCFRRRSAH